MIVITNSIKADELFSLFINSIPYGVSFYLFSCLISFNDNNQNNNYMIDLDSDFESDDE